jgi:GNAT superfamily N-acetyltransferase
VAAGVGAPHAARDAVLAGEDVATEAVFDPLQPPTRTSVAARRTVRSEDMMLRVGYPSHHGGEDSMSLAAPLHVGDIAIEEVDLRALSDDDYVRLNVFENIFRTEEIPEDPPRPLELTISSSRNIPDFVVVREFWARDPDGTIAAAGNASWTLTDDNKHLVRGWIGVRPDRRRRGLAKALLRVVADVTEAEGRTLLMSMTSERVPSGDAFASRMGAEAGQAVHTNRLVIAEVDREMIDRWIVHGPARAPGYSLLAFEGALPEEIREDAVDMFNVMNTAPRDDLELEDEDFQVEHFLQWEQSAKAVGDEWWQLFARHDASGKFAGYTHVSWNPQQPKTVYQYGTAVRPEHRGSALGKWLKATMLKRIMDERPDVADVRTGNADSNDAMLGINRGMGFRPFIAATWWQVTTEKLRDYLSGSSR